MNKNENKLVVKFNTCTILVNGIEHVVKTTTTTWKDIFNLHQKSDFFVHVNDIDDEDNKEEK